MGSNYMLVKEKQNKEMLIEIKKRFNELVLTGKKLSRENKCLLCNNSSSNLVSSHSIPQYILNSISENGYLYNPGAVNDDTNFILDKQCGQKKAGTFYLLCSNCDKTVFKYYEEYFEINNLFEKIKNRKIDTYVFKQLASIYLKSLLKEYYTKSIDVYVHAELSKEYKRKGIYNGSNMSKVAKLNLQDYKIDIDYCKEVIDGTSDKCMTLIDYIELNYTVPFTTQAIIAIQKDLKGKVINDVFNMSKDYHISELSICVFPIKGKTHILIFTLGKNKQVYGSFISQYKKLSKQDRLQLIQVLLFAYTEEIYIDEYLYNIFEKDKVMSSCIAEGVGVSSSYEIGPFIVDRGGEVFIEDYKNMKKCYFDRKYSKEFRH